LAATKIVKANALVCNARRACRGVIVNEASISRSQCRDAVCARRVRRREGVDVCGERRGLRDERTSEVWPARRGGRAGVHDVRRATAGPHARGVGGVRRGHRLIWRDAVVVEGGLDGIASGGEVPALSLVQRIGGKRGEYLAVRPACY